MIYLDNAATTFPKPETVYIEMDKVNRESAMNAGKGSYKKAQDISRYISETKDLIRKLVNVNSTSAVIFSSSITIAINQIIHGIDWKNYAVIYLSPYEHNAVARTIHQISKEHNVTVKELPIDEESLEIDIEKMKYEFSKDKPYAIFCTHISNVTGYILPIEKIFKEGKIYGSINILDTAQSLGLISVDASRIDVDIIAFAGHKSLYGPLGIGGFVNVSGVYLKEFITGGTGSDSLILDMPDDSESRYEAASRNIVAIAGLNSALQVLNVEDIFTHEKGLTKYLVEKLRAIRGIRLYIPQNAENHIGIVSFTVDGLLAEDVGIILDEDFDIAVRTGYHCAPLIHKYLHDEKSLGTVRIGLGQFTKKEDIDSLVNALKEVR